MIVNGGVGLRTLDNLSAGANMCYASQKLSDDNSYSAIAADFFLTYRLWTEHHRRSVFHRFFREVGFGGFIQFAGIGHDWRGLGQAIL